MLLVISGLASVGVIAPTVAHAVEINTDVGCDNPSAWMNGTGIAETGSKCVFTSATRMAMLMQMSTAIKENHRYKITGTLTGYSGSGIFQFFAGVKMPSAPTGTWIPASSVSVVPDNFDPNLGLSTFYLGNPPILRSTTGPGDDPERNGSFRVSCVSGGFKRVDSMVYPGTQAPHLHEFFGLSNMQKNWTYTDIRQKGISSCTNQDDPQHTINKSGYWAPAVLDGQDNALRTAPLLIYYKGPSNPALPATVSLTGSISGTTLTVTSTGGVTNPISPDGEFITGAGIPSGTSILWQISGTPLGVGTYHISSSATVGSETITLMSPHRYAGEADGSAQSYCASISLTADCRNVPRGLRFTFGYKSSFNATADPTGNLGPADTSPTTQGDTTHERTSINGISGSWQCDGGPNSEGAAPGVPYSPVYTTLQAAMDGHVCVKGSWINRQLGFPSCWDGINVDSPDHRAHMSWGDGGGRCLISGHSVKTPQISLLISYRIDQDFLDGKWHLSSDEMAACYDTGGIAGCTEHADYWEGWSDNCSGAQSPSCSIRETWYQHCNFAHNSCTNDIGDGRTLKYTNPRFGPTTGIFASNYVMASKAPPEENGMGKPITANGTYTFYIVAPDDGVWGILARKNASGSWDDIHVTDLGPASKGPVTVH
jgi:hypothetical protein